MNYKELIVKNHQMMSFNKIFAQIKPGENIFWPGCAMLSFGKALNLATYNLLKEQIPDLSFSTLCCGNPSMHIEHGKGFAERLATIKETLTANGVKNIYTICPNCYVTLLEHTDFNVKSAWSFLDGHLPKESQDSLKGRVLSIHDPCPIVKDIEAAHHVRNILQQLGAEIVEFDKNRENTMCCGKKNMIMALNPEKGKKIFHVRAKQLKTDEVATYCAACVDSFRDHDFTAHHVLELVFQMNATTSWINRYKAVGALKREV